MAFEVTAINVNLLADTAYVSLSGDFEGKYALVNLNVSIETLGNQPENRLKETARDASKRLLREALDALDR